MVHIINICVIFIFFGFSTAYAQQSTNSTGGAVTGIEGSVSYSIGQVFYIATDGENGNVTQGVQQPFEIVLITSKQDLSPDISFSVYPNPTYDHITMRVQELGNTAMTYQLYDLHGKVFDTKTITEQQTQVSTNQLLPGTYFLDIRQANNPIQTFKIIKN